MKASIALATYNGERYLPQLIESLLSQTRQADEVVICDDGSTDGTLSLLDEIIEERGLSNWHVHRNAQNMGWRKNFRQAIGACSGDIVFTCDQDDVWEPSKLEACMRAFEDAPDAQLIATNLTGIDADGRRTAVLLQDVWKDDGALVKKTLARDGLQHHRPGCVFCFRKTLYETLRPFDLDEYPHDSMLWKAAMLLDGAYLLNRRLIKYRLHDESADSEQKSTLAHRIARVEEDIEMCLWGIELCNAGISSDESRRFLEDTLLFSIKRLALLEARAFPRLMLFQFFNRHLYPTWVARAQDLLYVAKGSPSR